ncbi:MAG: hypothetical protein ACREQY_22305 [Candidatus Binatia bacterium]
MSNRPSGAGRPRRCLQLAQWVIVAGAVAFSAPGHAAGESPAALLGGFFRLEPSLPAYLDEALVAYEEGRFFDALRSLRSGADSEERDDVRFLRAVLLIGAGWEDLAAPSLETVLEAEPPGPYHVPALLELVEMHDRAGRWSAVADAWERRLDRSLRSRDSRSERIMELLFEFGSLRPPLAASTRREKSWLSKPKELAVLLEARRERASDRLLYRCGLALLRLGRHEESLRPLRMIGIESPYYPYARYSIAQSLFALGGVEEATRALARLDRYPRSTSEERALGSRARVLHAAIRFRVGEYEKGIRMARSVPDDDPDAARARLLVSTALLDAGKPALAVVSRGSSTTAIASFAISSSISRSRSPVLSSDRAAPRSARAET